MHLIQRIVAGVLGIVVIVLAFVFASVVLAVAAVAGLLLWAWLWWRSRKLRAAWAEGVRDGPVPPGQPSGDVIEGEFRDVTPEPRALRRDDS